MYRMLVALDRCYPSDESVRERLSILQELLSTFGGEVVISTAPPLASTWHPPLPIPLSRLSYAWFASAAPASQVGC
jgi:hypothetical protein